jgi:hypothetical protein
MKQQSLRSCRQISRECCQTQGKDEDMLNYLPVIVISTFSAWLASGGPLMLLEGRPSITALMHRWSAAIGFLDSGQLLALFCLGMAGLAQMIVVWAWTRCFRRPIILNYFLVLGLVFSGLSGLSSAGMAQLQFLNGHLMGKKVGQIAAPMIDAANGAADTAAKLYMQVIGLSQLSAERAKEEDGSGGTCPNITADSGPGKVQRLRKRQGTELAAVADVARGTRAKIDAAVSTFLRAPATQTAIDDLDTTIRLIVQSQEVADANARVSRLLLDFTEGSYDEQDKEEFRCDDGALTEKLAAAAKGWDAIMSLRLPAGHAGTEASLSDAYENTMDVLESLATGGERDQAGETALGIAGLVELIQILIIYLAQRHLRAMAMIRHDRDEFWRHGSPLSPKMKSFRKCMSTVVDARTMIVDGTPHFVTSNPASAEEALALDYFQMRPEDAATQAVPRRLLEMTAGWFEARAGLYGAAETFDFTPLPKDYPLWRRVVSRDAAH